MFGGEFGGVAGTPAIFKMESFAAIINNFQSCNIVAKLSMIYLCRGRRYFSSESPSDQRVDDQWVMCSLIILN